MFYGRGAGSLPTGSSIVSDVMEVARNVVQGKTGEMKQFYYPQKNNCIVLVKLNLLTTFV